MPVPHCLRQSAHDMRKYILLDVCVMFQILNLIIYPINFSDRLDYIICVVGAQLCMNPPITVYID